MDINLDDNDNLLCKSFDINTNGHVDLIDLAEWGEDSGTSKWRSDFNWDGTVNLLDFVMLVQHWGHFHPEY